MKHRTVKLSYITMPAKTQHPKPKQTALKAIEHLRDSASYEDIMYQLYVLQKIERGRQDIREGHTVSHEEAKERLGKWLK
jgi:predicted transcriptional regulator